MVINPYIEIPLRALFSFIFLLVFARMNGREQISQLTYFEYVVGITIGSIAATLTTTPMDPFLPGLLGMAVWAILPYLTGILVLKSVPARKIIEGEPVVVIQNGKIDEEALARQRLNLDDLMLMLREKDIFNIGDVENAVFETNGDLTVQRKSQLNPVTPADLNIGTSYQGLPTTVVQDGVLIENRLKEISLSKDWIVKKLQGEHGVTDISQVSIAQLDTSGNLYVDLINANPENKPH
ncbi:YetF domain-containing protein [Desulfallas thermosapovorans]|uniref:Uncharacterized membrane protein YcaP (DUF421 family) n=1 Tax=Desulfallas thermosapovorans DSM 6562 TaxID=1121431 RepID=A0A5S4ZYS4_9FIRM|nr:DUF421 domain-containing protein [Desulfallas thermosapovorans]TYO97291.1 uncharacterized membrane protein YcaP (DUF421 family) [Desulfallas thermosapovorans DSM 6562]